MSLAYGLKWISGAAAASRAYGLSGAEADALAPFPYVKLVSNAPGAGFETAARSILVLTK